MRRFIPLFLAACAVLAVVLFVRAPPREEPLPVQPPQPPNVTAPREAPAAPAAAALENAGTAAAPPAEASRSDAVAPPPVTAQGRARLVGRCVDPEGRGVARAKVYLTGHEGAWKGAAEVPVVEQRSHGHTWSFRQVESETDETGRFALDVPVPGGETWIRIAPSDDHDLFITMFGGERRGNHPELAEGTTDLGTLTLLATGRIEGTVRDDTANPIADAEVRLDGRFPGGYGRQASTDANGRYIVRAVPPGTYGVEALRNGWLTGNQPRVEVSARAGVSGVDFTLKRAPILRGRVVDTQGQGLGGVRINAWPIGSGQGAFRLTQDDGSFTLHLPQDEPYRIDIEAEGFERKDAAARSESYTPGTEGIELVLRRIATTQLVVVDAETGAPVESFSVALGEGTADQLGGGQEGEVASHPGGTLTLHAEPGKHAFGVRAAGYVPWSGPVRHDDAGGKQTVRLERGASIRGRVFDGGEPVRMPEVRLEGALVKLDPSKPDEGEEERWFSDNYRRDVPGFAAQRSTSKGADDGTFRIDGLAPGTYDLTVIAGAKAPLTRAAVRVELRQDLDLGDLALPKGGRVVGKVVPAPGQSPAGIAVELQWMDPERKATTDAEGRFAFEHLPPGQHEVEVELPTGRRTQGESVQVKVEEGKTSEVVIDLAASQPCRLRVLVRVQGKPRERVFVDLCDPEHGNQILQVGATEVDGVLDTEVPPCGRARLVFSAAFGQGFGQAPDLYEFKPGGRVETEVDLPAGSIELVFPDGFALPKLGHGSVGFVYEALPEETSHFLRWPHVQLQIAKGTAVERTSRRTWSGSRWEIGPIAPGPCTVRVQLSEYDDPNDQLHARWTFYEGKTTVVAGAKAACTLAKSDQPR